MGPFALTSLVALAMSLVLTAAVRTLARRWGVLDRPDGRRKLHARAIPRLGGVAVYGAAVLGMLAVRFGTEAPSTEFVELSTVWMIAAGFVCFVGSIDDRFDLPARVKLILQIISVLPIVLFGYYVDRVVAFGHPIELGWLGIPLTVLWLVGCINALNLIDGMDGLASMVGLATATMMGIIAANEGHPHVAVMASVLAASLLGFLMYNLPPASVFLGDSGSMVIGLSLGLMGIQGTLKTSATLAITAPAVVMTLPMFDIIAAVVRRKLTGRRFDAPDRLHIHHRLLDRGWTPWQVLCVIGAVCLTTGAAATAASIFRRDTLAWVTAMSLVVLMIRLRLFGYEEFALVKGVVLRSLRSGLDAARGVLLLVLHPDLRGNVESPIDIGILESDSEFLAQESEIPIPAMWDTLLRNVATWRVHQVEFCSFRDDQVRRIRWISPELSPGEDCSWSLSVSLPDPAGDVCELRACRLQPIADKRESAALAAVLKAFGVHFATHVDQFFGPPAILKMPTVFSGRPLPQRKAA
jgi:UDP-N-acetylmuramyl pentapeptide phosphotransferase/UDP-N-acetylglucosamine-1-phosphate transferase